VGTFAKLVAEIEADPRKLTLGFRRGVEETRAFRVAIENEMKKLPALNVVTPTHFNRLLKETKGDLEKATEAATRFNQRVEGIRASMVKMRAASQSNADMRMASSIAIADPFIYQAGRNARGGGMASVPAIAKAETAQGISRTNAAMIGVLFTLTNLGEQVAATDTKWNKLERTVSTALQGLSGVALAFGPKGMIVSGIAIATSFMLDFFSQARQEADALARAAEDNMNRLINARDSAAMMSRAQELYAGTPASGYRGIAQLERERLPIQTMLDNAIAGGRTPMVYDLQKQLDSIDKELMPLILEFERLKLAIMDVNNTPLQIKGLSPVTTRARGMPQTPEAVAQQLGGQAGALMGLFKAVAANQGDVGPISAKILEVHRKLEARLASIADKWSDTAISIRTILAEIESSPAARMLFAPAGSSTTNIPRVSTIPNAMPGATINVPELSTLPLSMGQRIRAALGPVADSVEKMGMYILQSSLGAVAQYGGAGGGMIAGIGSGALAGFAAGGAGGAVVGAVIGLAEGLLGMGAAAEQAREQVRQLNMAFQNFVMAQKLALGDISDQDFQIFQIQQQFEEARQAVIQWWKAMSIKDSIANVQEFQNRMNALNDLEKRRIDQLMKGADALGRVADSLTNIPEIWKVNLARWRAASPMTPIGGNRPPDRPGGYTGGGGGSGGNELMSAGGGGVVIINGDVIIEKPVRDGEELLEEFTRVLGRDSMRRTGRSGGWLQGIV
jgi:hypothetical protein